MRMQFVGAFVGVAALLSVSGAARGQYENGFSWRFVPDFSAGVNNGDSVARGNPGFDARGSLVWSYEWVPAGGQLGSGNPWFNAASTLMVWDTDNGTGSTPLASWARGDNTGPFIQSGRLVQRPGPSDAKPLLRFTNPQPGAISVSLSDFIFVKWENGASSAVDLILAQWDASARVHVPLFFTTLEKPLEGSVVIVAPDVPNISLDRNDSLILTAQGRGTSLGTIVVEPNPLVTLIAGGECRADANGDRVVNFADITEILVNFGTSCP